MGAFASLSKGKVAAKPPVMQQLEEIAEEQEAAPPPPPVSRPAAPAPARTAARPAPRVPASTRPMVPAKVNSIFSGIEDAQARQQRPRCKPGRYLARIDEVIQNYDRNKIPYVLIKMTVVHVFNDAAGLGHRVGEAASHYIGAGDYFLSDFKGFIQNALGCDPATIDEGDCIAVVSEDQPLAGFVVEWEGVQKPGKKPNADGTPKFFTNVFYSPRWEPEQVEELLGPEGMAQFFPPEEAA